jgi:hypothetical protein
MYGEGEIRIKKLTNGYSVYYSDPDVVKANDKRDMSSKGGMPYRSPEREMAFKDVESLTMFLRKNIDKLCSHDDYETSFSAAVMEQDDDK